MSQKIAILGASGYTGAELVRLIATHPTMEIVALSGDRKAGMAMGDVFPHLGIHFGQEVGGGGVEMAGQHDVLPDHQPHLIAEVIEPIRLIPPAAPDADHVHMGVFGRLQQFVERRKGSLAMLCQFMQQQYLLVAICEYKMMPLLSPCAQ